MEEFCWVLTRICHKHSNVNTLRSHFLAWENNWNSERGCHDLPPTRTSPSSFSVWQAILASLTCWRDLIWSFVRPNKSNPPVKRHKILTQLQISLLKISRPFTCRKGFCRKYIITWFSISDVPKCMLLIMSSYLHEAFFHKKMNLFLYIIRHSCRVVCAHWQWCSVGTESRRKGWLLKPSKQAKKSMSNNRRSTLPWLR